MNGDLYEEFDAVGDDQCCRERCEIVQMQSLRIRWNNQYSPKRIARHGPEVCAISYAGRRSGLCAARSNRAGSADGYAGRTIDRSAE
jgi:hypothetical protein